MWFFGRGLDRPGAARACDPEAIFLHLVHGMGIALNCILDAQIAIQVKCIIRHGKIIKPSPFHNASGCYK